MRSDVPDSRVLVGLLGDAPTTDAAALAARLDISPQTAAHCLSSLHRDGLVDHVEGGGYRQVPLEADQVRELYPAVAILESLALRHSPLFGEDALSELRAANARFRAAVGEPPALMAADDDFHQRLTADCGNARLLEVLHRMRRELLPYERAFMVDASRIERSAAQHDAIIAALEAGDHGAAGARVRDNFMTGLAELTAQIERG
jgi:DNA-binding GntR family transcriptional regulator